MAGRRAGAPAARLIAETDRLRTDVAGERVADHRPFEIALRLALHEIDDAAAEMAEVTADGQGRATDLVFDGDRAPPLGRVADDVHDATKRDPRAGGNRRRQGKPH